MKRFWKIATAAIAAWLVVTMVACLTYSASGFVWGTRSAGAFVGASVMIAAIAGAAAAALAGGGYDL